MMMPENYYSRIINGQHTTELPDYRIRIIKSDRTTTELNEHYIGITNTDHMTELKEKFKRMCEESMRRKQHMHLIHDEFLMTESLEIMSSFVAPSLACRQDLVVVEVPSQGREATVRTIKEWSQYSTAKITDLFYVTTPQGRPWAKARKARALGATNNKYFRGAKKLLK
ncbi:hypothetical protein N665_0550s0008 [Sinapis alba]|nr:hypothetical protein N665_0550s0008 [Sinapis alba]